MGQDELNQLSKTVIGAAIEVHRHLGPGLLESAYERCLQWELNNKRIAVRRQVELPVRYKGTQLDCGYRLDLLVANRLIVELKTADAIEPIHEAQLLSYLRLSELQLGLIINFNVPRLRDGVKRIVNNL